MNYTPPQAIQPQSPAEEAGYYTEKAAEIAAPVAGGALRVARALPSAEAAGQIFQSLDAAIGANPVDISTAGDVALEAQDWASRGGQMPKVMKDFIKHATDPNLGDLTYSETRQFLSNAGERLSTAGQMKLPPKATRYPSQFASSLNDAIRDVAQDAGVLDDYNNAVDQYR